MMDRLGAHLPDSMIAERILTQRVLSSFRLRELSPPIGGPNAAGLGDLLF